MSRETDSSSSGPHGRGGPPYGPGSEPYGAPSRPSDAPEAGGDAPAPADEPKTETTLTTRIRINIPGSRPIPPVVMRKTVGEGGDAGAAGGEAPDSDPSHRTGPGSRAASGSTGGSGSGPVSTPGGAAASGAASGTGAGSASGRGADPGSGSGAGEAPRGTSDWFAPRKPPRPAPDPEPPVAERPGAEDGRTATPPDGFPTVAGLGGTRGSGGAQDGALSDFLDRPPSGFDPGAPAGPPSGRTTGPQTGDMPVRPIPDGSSPGPTPGSVGDPGALGRPKGPDVGPPGTGAPGTGTGSGFGQGSTSALYSQGPTPPAPPRPRGDDRITGDTLVSGIPRVPSVDSVFPPDAPGPRPVDHGLFDDDRDDRDDRRDGDPDVAPDRGDRGDRDGDGGRRKGRSKLVLAGVSLVGVVAIAYGAGLLLDHADVPNGTTVLGVDIGGQTRQDATNTLDAALKSRMTDPIPLVVDGREEKVEPETLGLTIDTDETVRAAAGRDYNPVSVIGSLFGGTRVVDAHVKVDDEKLTSAVGRLHGNGGKDGRVVFTGGKPAAVPGKPYEAVEVGKAATLVEDAYRERAATGRSAPVTLPVSTQQPKIGEQELQAAVEGFGKDAMSGWVWLRAGDVEVPFSQQTIGTFLVMEAPSGGTLQPVIDLEKLEATYGSAFDGVVIDGGAGTVPMQPKHAASAMVDALREPAPPTPQKRVAEVTGARSQ
ncbi:hypothetical protein E4198_07890 [Streptomyces sp. RKND-216]|uniref:hypothetical protein n=1 Tax=Streptomyces sp. RKND-216 TaxID=2562581 RepID=UPI00109E0EFB|nr:hypothetical protein [Streptomyces sp. RKND-216]THA24672.1 hypothetical protein E4198_07890 [Streptomyces sp. RKND-216]